MDTTNITFIFTTWEPEYSLHLHVYRFLQLNYQFMKRCVESGPTMSIQDEWYYNILEMIPEKLKDKKEYREALKVLFDEVVTDFAKSMKKSMGRNFFVIFSRHYTIYLFI